jgi:hypothetical protein
MNCPHGVDRKGYACPLCERARAEAFGTMNAVPTHAVLDLGSRIVRVTDLASCEHPAPRSGWCPDCGGIRDEGIWVLPIVMSRVWDLDEALRLVGADPRGLAVDFDAKNVIPMKPRS